MLYCMSVAIGCLAQVWTVQRCGCTARSELPRTMGLAALGQCSTASAGVCNLVKAGGGEGNI